MIGPKDGARSAEVVLGVALNMGNWVRNVSSRSVPAARSALAARRMRPVRIRMSRAPLGFALCVEHHPRDDGKISDPHFVRDNTFGYPGKNLGWIFARDADVNDAAYQSRSARFADRGHNPPRFRRVLQRLGPIGLADHY